MTIGCVESAMEDFVKTAEALKHGGPVKKVSIFRTFHPS